MYLISFYDDRICYKYHRVLVGDGEQTVQQE